MTIYDRIKEERLRQGLSQDELSKKVGYSGRSGVSKIENGERDITQTQILKFAEALGVSPAYLLTGEAPVVKDVQPSISEDERRLLAKYNALNPLGKERLQAYAEAMTDNPKYVTPDTKTKIAEDVIDEFLQVPTPTSISTK